MAKYRHIETGLVVDDAKEGSDYVCNKIQDCECPLNDYIHEHAMFCTDEIAEEAFAKLYKECGFEEVEETEENTKSSRLAEILGVEEDQEWTIEGNPDIIFRIHNGERQWKGKSSRKWDYCCQEAVLTKLINNPNLIQPISSYQWTVREIEIAKAWKTMNPNMTQFTINAFSDTEIEIDCIPLVEDKTKCPNFFSCNNKQIKVSDILGES